MDWLLDYLHTFSGQIVAVYVFATGTAAVFTQFVRDLEHHVNGGRSAWFWNHALRLLSAAAGSVFAMVARRVLADLPPPDGLSAISLPSPLATVATGFLAGFFLTTSVWLVKNRLTAGRSFPPTPSPSALQDTPNATSTPDPTDEEP